MNTNFKVAEYLVDLLENKFTIGRFRFGLDPVLGLFPGVGDAIALLISLYVVWIGMQLKVPADKVIIMIGNVLLDFFLGLFPVVGDAIDFVYRSNSLNMKIIKKYRKHFVEGEVI